MLMVIMPSAVNGDKGRIPGLAQLVRKMYQISYDGAIFGNYDEAKENKYTVSKLNAILRILFISRRTTVLSWRKVLAIIITMRSWRLVQMVSSVTIRLVFLTMTLAASLKAQTLNETRTSAFYIAPDQTPLYRQFNNALLGENADNSADSLMFTLRLSVSEYLMDE